MQADQWLEYSLVTGGHTVVNNDGRRRLTQQARDILEDYFLRVSQWPSHIDSEALLEKIKAIPECGYYDMGRMLRWFSTRRTQLRSKERKERAQQQLNDPRFPSLTPATIQHLTVLASNQLHPSPELLKTWATLLAGSGANEQDVTKWVHYQIQEQHLSTPMTPESSMSPTSPTQSTFPEYKQETMLSPVIPTLQLEHPRTTPSEPSSPTTLLPTSNLTNDPESKSVLNPRPQDPVLQAIIHGVHDALANPETTPNAAPKTAAEFEAMFSPFEQQISLLIRALETT